MADDRWTTNDEPWMKPSVHVFRDGSTDRHHLVDSAIDHSSGKAREPETARFTWRAGSNKVEESVVISFR
jgi:hypothetical protein